MVTIVLTLMVLRYKGAAPHHQQAQDPLVYSFCCFYLVSFSAVIRVYSWFCTPGSPLAWFGEPVWYQEWSLGHSHAKKVHYTLYFLSGPLECSLTPGSHTHSVFGGEGLGGSFVTGWNAVECRLFLCVCWHEMTSRRNSISPFPGAQTHCDKTNVGTPIFHVRLY